MGDVLIHADKVSKKFCRSLKKSLWYGVRDSFADLAGRRSSSERLRADEFWAVNDVSFEVRRGECLGLIGRNGAGKTTLLKMLNGLIKPDGGRIELKGRVGALIALGAGFNPILSGRENVYVNGSILGLTKKEIDRKFDEIVDFAEIADFIDAPVQSYSSGMTVRLGFAVATAVEPDILLLDEVLAVGDVAFRSKCMNRIEKLRSKAAVILVSHHMTDVARVCGRAIMMSRGAKAVQYDDIARGISAYETSTAAKAEGFVLAESGFSLLEAKLSTDQVEWGGDLEATIRFISPIFMDNAEARITLMDEHSQVQAEWRSSHNCGPLTITEGENLLTFNIGPLLLSQGNYVVGYVLSAQGVAQYLILSFRKDRVRVNGGPLGLATHQLKSVRPMGVAS